MKILAIAVNTFKENIRDRILYNLLIFALIMIGLSAAFGSLTIGEQVKLTIDIGLFCISIFGVMIAIFLGIQLVFKEIDRKTIYTMISKPLPRYQFLLGKFLGLMLTILVNVVIMSLAFALMLFYMNSSMNWSIIQAIILILVELSLITSVALLFSSFSTPTLSAIFTLSFFVIGRMVEDIKHFGSVSESEMVQTTSKVIYHIIPNLQDFIPLGGASSGQVISGPMFVQLIAIGLMWTALYLILAITIFHKRDFV